jgi:hypothetical protein
MRRRRRLRYPATVEPIARFPLIGDASDDGRKLVWTSAGRLHARGSGW